MPDVSEVRKRVKATPTQNLGLLQPNFGEKRDGGNRQKIANVHVEALRRGAFLSGQTRIDESHIPDTWKGTSSVYLMVPR